jgi:hypothetical protein
VFTLPCHILQHSTVPFLRCTYYTDIILWNDKPSNINNACMEIQSSWLYFYSVWLELILTFYMLVVDSNFCLRQIATLLWLGSVGWSRALISHPSTQMDWTALGTSQHPEGTRLMPHSHTLSWKTTTGYGGLAIWHKIVHMIMLRYGFLGHVTVY